MRQLARMRRGAMTAALLAATLTGSLMTGCTSGGGAGGGAIDDGRGQTQGPTDGNHPTASGGSVLAVKIDNVRAARPQTGLDAADVVYAEQVEGGLSRLMAVYASKFPKVIGPVRSARESDLELLRQFDEPTLAFSGAQHKLLPLIDKAPLHARPPGKVSGAFYRGTDKPAPHNLYLRPRQLMGSAPGSAALTTGFHFGAAPAGGSPATSSTVRFPAARFTFTWSDSRQRWLVDMDGTPTVTTEGTKVAPATVVVQYVKVHESQFHDFLGNNTPYTETVGSGTAKVLRDGRVFHANWSRPGATDGTEFTTTDGAPMNFAQGQVWVVFAKA
ncbi:MULTISPECIES: DUF3048 domain-containing protein [unclassified Streptomyces]|uniref:DUF3048 domain-containing protein n=1 Tax=unclassified Streptomyces TaxID=2593676 RepID=UPI002E7FE1CF|nr:DUF3048 domain-containing protein [Streptomyces sp. NBC_00589]WTI34543.1 DUF3048 domain-containing protein [Streptomyces sp. NBC_00775]WUB31785.1 DUF3048 domain-containing protein [Streptomyces sp. NBC_00589]